MNKLPLSLCVACAVLVTFVAGAASGAEKKKSTPEPVRPFISAMSGDTITVTTGQNVKTLTLKSNSEVLVNGQKGAAADLKVGMLVSNVGVGTDPAVVSRISVADAPPTQTGGGKRK